MPAAPLQSLAPTLFEIIRVFLKLGLISFGGPAVHIAMMQDEVVRRRGWLTREEFLDLLSATNFIPGPNSTEMAIHIGHRMAGWRGLLAAGICFILPAFFIVLLFAWAYVEYGNLPSFQIILYGTKPVIIAVIGQAIWALGSSTIKNKLLFVVAVISVLANLFGVGELMVIVAAGIVVAVFSANKPWKKRNYSYSFLIKALVFSSTAAASTIPITFSLSKLFLVFLKVGSVLFGSGYVLFAFLRTDLVERLQWITEAQLLDAIAVGQFTPGPLFTTATFIGYLLAGPAGALLSTIGIFLPAFFFVAISARLIPKLRKNKTIATVLDGVNVGSLSVMLATTIFLANKAIVDLFTLLLAISSAFVLLRFKINSAWLILVGGFLGYAWRYFI